MENNIVIKIPNGSNSATGASQGGQLAGSKVRRMMRMLRQSGSQGAQSKARVGPGLEEDSPAQEAEAEGEVEGDL